MASDQLPPPTTTEEDTPTPTATASELPAAATEPVVAADEPEGEGGDQQAETEKVEEKEDEPAAETTLPRQSLEVEGSDLEEEMNQISNGHAALVPPPVEEEGAVEGQSTPTIAAESQNNPFLTRKAPPPDILTSSPSGSNPALEGEPAPSLHPPESPTFEMIETLKKQLEAVTDQRDMLNSKLVMSFSRVADLEDDLDHVQQMTTEQRSQIDILKYERSEHLHALDTGLLVERSNVKNELQRLAANLVEEQGKRGVAEEGRRTVENEVDDLAASLFQQANSMVATERLARSRAETRLASTEENLQVAEGVVRELQVAMQTLSHAQPFSPPSKPRQLDSSSSKPRPLLTSHVPYTEFLLFVQHLRSLRPLAHSATQIPPPTLVSLMSHPFIARLVAEDHEPALRLDFAPGVTFFSKKSISHAIIDGMLMIEPVQAHKVFLQKPEGEIICSLSGKQIVPSSENHLIISHSSPSTSTFPASSYQSHSNGALPPPPPPPPAPMRASLSSGASRFFGRGSRPASPTLATPALPPVSSTSTSSPNPLASTITISSSHPPIYVFRIAPPPSAAPSSSPPHLYPIESGWSLERLRATCELWRFVKMGIIVPIWSYEDGTNENGGGLGLTEGGGERPPLPPRKTSKGWGLGGLGGLGFKAGGVGSGWNLGIGGGSVSAPNSPQAETTPTEEKPVVAKEAPRLPPRRNVPPPPPGPRIVSASRVEEVKPAVVVASEEEKVEEVASPVVIVVPEPEASAPISSTLEVEVNSTPSTDEATPPTEPIVVTSESSPLPTDAPALSSPPPTSSDATPPPATSAGLPETTEESTTESIPHPVDPTTPKSSSSEGFSTPVGEAAPLPLVTPEEATKEEVPSISATEPEVLAAEPVIEPSAPEETVVVEPTSSSDDASSSTPKPEVTEEPTVEASASTIIATEPTPTTPTLRTSLDGARPTTPSTPGSAPPPPLPKRAAARRPVPAAPGAVASNRNSVSSISDLTVVPPVVVAPATPLVGATEVEEKKEEEVETSDVAAVEETHEKHATVPSLPPRKQKMESWEEKTWRELVNVKEDLFWKRVGVRQEE
ncbi:hypothetical protein BDY24DRAFT_143498 [Mrakia frigida]|uniref:uncharacterized protein n=1 Tax=Mrakia frigida TaxID=29902 RepID=UPI003FCC1351